MNRKTFLIHTLALAAALFTGAASAQAVKLTLAHGTALDNPRHTAALKFADVVKAKSNGRNQTVAYDSLLMSHIVETPQPASEVEFF